MVQLWFIEYPIAFIGLFVAVLITLVYLQNINNIDKQKRRKTKWEPTVTVLIPAFNESEYIAACIESVLALDYPKEKLEIIVLDDGSTDNTAEIASRYAKKGVKVIRKKNTGKADTLNQGIRIAKGELIATLDADSYVSPYSLRRMLIHFDAPDVAAVASAVKVREARNIIEEVQRIEYLYALFSRKIVNFLNAVQVTPGPFSIFRKEALLKVGGFDTKSLVEDQEIALRLQKHGYKINSSIDSDVYTEIPHNFMELMKQRTRWQRGGFWNSVKYLDMIHPKYGDLGMLVLPFGIFGYVMLVVGIGLFIYYILSISPYEQFIGWQVFFLNWGPLHVFVLIWFAIAMIWFFYGIRRMFESEKLGLLSVLAYLLLYPLFTTIFWFSAAYTEIKTGGRFSW